MDEFQKVLDDCEVIMSNLPEACTTAGKCYPDTLIKICGGLGKGKPHFSIKSGIFFNGDAKKDLQHETFSFNPFNDVDFDFCKAARKPYDFVVCCVLISLQNRMTGFKFTSDGNTDDWEPAFDFFKKVVGEIDINKFFVED